MTIRFRAGLMAAIFVTLPTLADDTDVERLLDSAQKQAQSGQQVPASTVFLYSLIPTPTPAQREVLDAFDRGEWQKAFQKYEKAFAGSQFAQSANGKAFSAYLLFRIGAPVSALEQLFKQVSQAREVHPELRQLWRTVAPETHFAWDLAEVKWSPTMAEIFPAQMEYRIFVRNLGQVKSPEKLKAIFDRIPSNTPSRALVGWHLLIAYAANNNVTEAARVMAELIRGSYKPVSEDLMNLTIARLLYQRAQPTAAIRYYQKIPKTSEYWTDAQEEMAWAYLRKSEPGNAVAVSQSLVPEAMAIQSGPEGYYVHSISRLKLCDYVGALNHLKSFSKVFKPREEKLSQLSTEVERPEVSKIIGQLQAGRVNRSQLKRDGNLLPRLISRDETLFQLAQAQKNFANEARALKALEVATVNDLQSRAESRSSQAGQGALKRIQELAKWESKEIGDVLRKLQIVEVEVIQQVALAERRLASVPPIENQKGQTGALAKDVLRFKESNPEIWMDEIGFFRMDVRAACNRRTL